MSEETKVVKSKKLAFSISWKVLSLILAVGLVGLAMYTKPWDSSSSSARTIEITGEASIKRAPDSFVFNPSYEAKSQEAITAKTNEVVKGLKDLGLGDAGIQTQVSNYEDYKSGYASGEYIYSLYMTLAIEDKDLAQKVQDYLVASGATGQITPTTNFTKATQKSLRDEATTLAVADAKQRAEQTAKNLGVKLGKVVKINEPDQVDVYPIASYDSASLESGKSLPINAGESEYPLSIKVEFEIK